MVSIHRIPFVVYLTIRVLCFIFRLKREAHPSLASPSRRLRIAQQCRNEQLRTSRRYMYISYPIHPLCLSCNTPQANEHNSGCIDTTYLTSFFVALFLTMVECFLRTSGSQNQSVRIRHYLYVCPHHPSFDRSIGMKTEQR